MKKARKLTEPQRRALKLLIEHPEDWHRHIVPTGARDKRVGVWTHALMRTLSKLGRMGLARLVQRGEVLDGATMAESGWVATREGRAAVDVAQASAQPLGCAGESSVMYRLSLALSPITPDELEALDVRIVSGDGAEVLLWYRIGADCARASLGVPVGGHVDDACIREAAQRIKRQLAGEEPVELPQWDICANVGAAVSIPSPPPPTPAPQQPGEPALVAQLHDCDVYEGTPEEVQAFVVRHGVKGMTEHSPMPSAPLSAEVPTVSLERIAECARQGGLSRLRAAREANGVPPLDERELAELRGYLRNLRERPLTFEETCKLLGADPPVDPGVRSTDPVSLVALAAVVGQRLAQKREKGLSTPPLCACPLHGSDSAGECYALAHDQPYEPRNCQRACECPCHAAPAARTRGTTDFEAAFVALKRYERELQAEIEWISEIHRRDQTGQARSDQKALRGLQVAAENLAAATQRVANALGFGWDERRVTREIEEGS